MRPVGSPVPTKGQHEKFSPRGSSSGNSEMPTITPLLFLTGQATALFGPPPSVPRGIVDPCSQRVATDVASPARLSEPVTQPRLLMPLALPAVPPSSPSSTTWYLDWAASGTGIAVAANKVIAIMHFSIRGFMLSPSLSASAPKLSDR